MRKTSEIDAQIKRLRFIFKNQSFSEQIRDTAWNMMLTLQWVRTDNADGTDLGPMDLCGINYKQAAAIKKQVKRLP